jgi:hypothetical protein
MSYPMRHIWNALFLALILFLLIAVGMPMEGHAQVIDFNRLDSHGVSISEKSYRHIERFLTHVFPMQQMRRYARIPGNAHPTRLRRVTYEVLTQGGVNFVLAGYAVQWNESVNELAIYRMEISGPNQVWRSRPWTGSSGDLHFQSVSDRDRNIILFQEGGAEREFGLASVFTFRNAPDGLFLHDLTPSLPWLRANTHFPFHTLYAEQISMRAEDDGSANLKNSEKNEIVLSASDEEYNLGMARLIRPERSWKYNSPHNRFEPMKATPSLEEPEATNNR